MVYVYLSVGQSVNQSPPPSTGLQSVVEAEQHFLALGSFLSWLAVVDRHASGLCLVLHRVGTGEVGRMLLTDWLTDKV